MTIAMANRERRQIIQMSLTHEDEAKLQAALDEAKKIG